MKLIENLKSRLLTKLFLDWVTVTTDLETLQFSKELIVDRYNNVNGHSPIIGFRQPKETKI